MKFKLMILLVSISLTACSVLLKDSAPSNTSELENLGPAPELSNTTWINVDHPLRLEDLRGQVVLLDMWTYG